MSAHSRKIGEIPDYARSERGVHSLSQYPAEIELDFVQKSHLRSNAFQLCIDVFAVVLELFLIIVACAAVVGAAVILMLVSF